MTKQEQINKIAEELLAYQPLIDIPFEQFYKVARAIVDLGYRKVDKDSVILTKEELVKTMESKYVYDTTRGNKINLIEMAREIERKETTTNFFKDLIRQADFWGETDMWVNYKTLVTVAKQYGVEVEG